MWLDATKSIKLAFGVVCFALDFKENFSCS